MSQRPMPKPMPKPMPIPLPKKPLPQRLPAPIPAPPKNQPLPIPPRGPIPQGPSGPYVPPRDFVYEPPQPLPAPIKPAKDGYIPPRDFPPYKETIADANNPRANFPIRIPMGQPSPIQNGGVVGPRGDSVPTMPPFPIGQPSPFAENGGVVGPRGDSVPPMPRFPIGQPSPITDDFRAPMSASDIEIMQRLGPNARGSDLENEKIKLGLIPIRPSIPQGGGDQRAQLQPYPNLTPLGGDDFRRAQLQQYQMGMPWQDSPNVWQNSQVIPNSIPQGQQMQNSDQYMMQKKLMEQRLKAQQGNFITQLHPYSDRRFE